MSLKSLALSVLLVVLLLGSSAAYADNALVVGCDHFPRIPGANLEGCVNDARSVAEVLKKHGFAVTFLANEQATRQGILQALREMAARNKPSERFAFYFAGHGSGPDPATILTNSSLPDSNANDIKAEELNSYVKEIPASSRTVLLDSCFSGAMTRAIDRLHRKGLHSRFWKRTRSIGEATASNGADAPQVGSAAHGPGPVCYFCAARRNEVANEDAFGKSSHGVFTYYLVGYLGKVNNASWEDALMKVGSEVSERLDDQQHPTLSPGYNPVGIFQPVNAEPTVAQTTVKPANLWQMFNADAVDRSRLALTMDPNLTSLHLGQQVSFATKVGAEGYLVIIEHGVSGKFNLMYPSDPSVDAAHVTAGQTVDIPGPDQAYAPDQEGTERVRAMLFHSKDAAEKLLAGFQEAGAASGGVPMEQLVRSFKRTRDFKLVMKAKPADNFKLPFYTSDVIVQVEK